MDTTKIYVDLCKKARPIQKIWRPEVGQYYYDPAPHRYEKPGVKIIKNMGTGFKKTSSDRQSRIWLPRQDELTDLIAKNKKITSWCMLILDFNDWIQKMEYEGGQQKESIEQMMLHYYMGTCHNMVWFYAAGAWKIR